MVDETLILNLPLQSASYMIIKVVGPTYRLCRHNGYRTNIPFSEEGDKWDVTNRPGPDPSVSDEELLRSMHMAYKPALGTTEIAEMVGISQQAASKRLNRLEEERLVESDKIGNARAWWLTDYGRRYLASSENDPSNQ
jgi:DNA-binding transcriptional ArsR family regulator